MPPVLPSSNFADHVNYLHHLNMHYTAAIAVNVYNNGQPSSFVEFYIFGFTENPKAG